MFDYFSGGLDDYYTGATIKHFTGQDLARYKIPLPPLGEQRRIAAILDKADALRQKRKRAIALLDSLTQSIFLEMFGPHSGRNHARRRVADICRKVTDGTHQAPNWADSGVPFLFVSNVRNQQLGMVTNKFVSDDEYIRLTRSTPIEHGDILYTAVGSYGHAAVVPRNAKFVFQRHIAHLKPNVRSVLPEFLSIALESPDAKSQADALARGNAQKTVPLSALKEITVPVPPMEDQKMFVDRMLKVRPQAVAATTFLVGLDAAFASLQNRAFSGQL
jgi:type I restriction enzyme S subunit